MSMPATVLTDLTTPAGAAATACLHPGRLGGDWLCKRHLAAGLALMLAAQGILLNTITHSNGWVDNMSHNSMSFTGMSFQS